MMPVTKEALKQGLSTIRSGLHKLNTDKQSSAEHTISSSVLQLFCSVSPSLSVSVLCRSI